MARTPHCGRLSRSLLAIPLASGLGTLLFAASAAALDFSNGDVSVESLSAWGFINPNGAAGSAGPESLSFDSGNTDDLYEYFGWFGTRNGMVAVDSTNFDLDTTFTASGNVATADLSLSSAGATALNLSVDDILITHTFMLIDDTGANDFDEFLFDVTITNNSGSRLPFRYYSYLDLDMAGTFTGDSAIGDQNGITVSEGAETLWWGADGGANRYEVTGWPDIRNDLDSATAAFNLSKSGTPFGPGDFTAAQQINENLADQGVSYVRWRIVEGPEPGTALLLGAGLFILGVRPGARRPGSDRSLGC